jgi:hypothetical protein
MKRIYEIAEAKSVEIHSYQKPRIDTMKAQLPDKVLRSFSKEQFEKYIEACWCCGSEHAGGYDGWSKGHELLKELGFVNKERQVGHRVFVSMVYAPQSADRIKELENL